MIKTLVKPLISTNDNIDLEVLIFKTKFSDVKILEKPMIDWVKDCVLNYKTTIQNFNEKKNELEQIKMFKPKSRFLLVLYSFNPLLTKNNIDLCVDYLVLKGEKMVKLPFGYIFETEYLKTLTPEEKYFYDMMVQGKTDEEIIAMFESLVPNTNSTYEGNMKLLEACDISDPLFISLYPKDFAGKDYIEDYINNYNALHATEEGKEIRYTDYIGIMLSSISTIIDAISYVLIAFVSISLIVSSIMIGVITYISVLERTKEIGVLRSLGARKKDISSIFNAETLIIGLASGLLGVGVTVVLCIPINLIIDGLAGIGKIAKLPLAGGIILVVISMFLTFIAGLIPSRYAAKKDPVIALRTE